MSQNLDLIVRYLRLIESFATEPELFAEVWHRDFQHTEYPNLITKKGQVRTMEECLIGAAKGKKILREQHFELQERLEGENRVIVEGIWTGIMAVNAGPLTAGQQLKAHFAMVFEFQDGRIIRQRNYDCYDPF